MIRVTLACPEALIGDANQLASVLGYSRADAATFGLAVWRDADGHRYAVASTLAAPNFRQDATAPLVAPAWEADLDAARRAQALLRIGGAAAPAALVAVIGEDPRAALAELCVKPASSLPNLFG